MNRAGPAVVRSVAKYLEALFTVSDEVLLKFVEEAKLLLLVARYAEPALIYVREERSGKCRRSVAGVVRWEVGDERVFRSVLVEIAGELTFPMKEAIGVREVEGRLRARRE